MGQISIRLDDKTEIKLKREARENGKSLAEYCREQLTGEFIQQPINEVTLEKRIENIEYIFEKLLKKEEFLSQFIYEFMIMAKSEEAAKIAWENAKNKS